jgi:hypothetical protein
MVVHPAAGVQVPCTAAPAELLTHVHGSQAALSALEERGLLAMIGTGLCT